MKIAVVGLGAAAIGFLERMKDSAHEIHVFERSKDIESSSLSGIRSDGKLIVSTRVGGDLEVPLELQEKVVDHYLDALYDFELEPRKDEVEGGSSFTDKNAEIYQKFYAAGFDPVESKCYHIGTEELGGMLRNILRRFEKHENIHFHFGCCVESIVFDNNEGEKVCITYPSYHSDANNFTAYNNDLFDKVIIAAGRSGMKLIKRITSEYPNFVQSNTNVDFGVRFELPNHIVNSLNEMYDFKLRYKTDTGFIARTFCNNPGGKVVSEIYNGGEIFTVNGHAESVNKTDNTNFAILVSHRLTQPFNDPIAYGSNIAKLSNLLAGGKKVLLQTYGDFLKAKRTKRIGRVKPTLPESEFTLGDLNLVFPSRTVRAIVEFIEKFDSVVPGLASPDNLLYGVEVKFYSNVLDNAASDRVKFIGDCSGWTRSIVYATAHGIVEANKIMGCNPFSY